MKTTFALVWLAVRATLGRLAALFSVSIVFGLAAALGPWRNDPLFLSFVVAMAIVPGMLAAVMILSFSPLEDMTLVARPFMVSLPMSPWLLCSGIMVVTFGSSLVFVVVTHVIVLVALVGRMGLPMTQQVAALLLLPLARCTILIAGVTVMGFWDRMVRGKGAAMRNGALLVGILLSIGVILRKVPWIFQMEKSLSSPQVNGWDAIALSVFLVSLGGTAIASRLYRSHYVSA